MARAQQVLNAATSREGEGFTRSPRIAAAPGPPDLAAAAATQRQQPRYGLPDPFAAPMANHVTLHQLCEAQPPGCEGNLSSRIWDPQNEVCRSSKHVKAIMSRL